MADIPEFPEEFIANYLDAVNLLVTEAATQGCSWEKVF